MRVKVGGLAGGARVRAGAGGCGRGGRQLDPDRFLGAPRGVMEQTMRLLREEYGGAAAYMDRIGFGPADRLRLRDALCAD